MRSTGAWFSHWPPISGRSTFTSRPGATSSTGCQLLAEQLLTQLFGREQKAQFALFTASRRTVPLQPARLLPLPQQGTHVALAAKAVLRHGRNADALRFALAKLPKALKLINPMKLSHD